MQQFLHARKWDLGRLIVFVAAATLLASWAGRAEAQVFTQTRAVGGISINADGLLDNSTTDATGQLRDLRMKELQDVPAALEAKTELRKVSLRQLEATLADCLANGKPIPDAVKYVAGLQRIQFVFVYPEQNDIVLVGPSEGWKVDAAGNVVGVTTGQPVMLLDDLIVAMRTAKQAAQGGITCSIDPTSEGLRRMDAIVGQAATQTRAGNVKGAAALMEQAMGPQKISVGGVSPESHFARVLVAADYRMKRIGMGFDRSPVRGLPSYMTMLPSSGVGSQMPRWWLEPRYEPVLKDADGLAWELRGGSVKTMTEDDFLAANGQREHSGKASASAQRWADLMTEHYDELAVAEPVFGQLRNCMELAIVSALIVKNRLPERANLSLPVLLESSDLKTEQFPAPKSVASRASLIHKSNKWIVSVSGGVLINSWAIADRTEQGEAPAAARAQAAPQSSQWWWN